MSADANPRADFDAMIRDPGERVDDRAGVDPGRTGAQFGLALLGQTRVEFRVGRVRLLSDRHSEAGVQAVGYIAGGDDRRDPRVAVDLVQIFRRAQRHAQTVEERGSFPVSSNGPSRRMSSPARP